MGSNGNQRLDQLSHAYILNLQLQWTPMGSNGKLVYALTMLKFFFIQNYLFHASQVNIQRDSHRSPLESIGVADLK